ncbi:unnamed protein product [Dicrocoelium dendriticum]|nr:unnamed protein product [Dicrocoelium dendriticum]
MGKRVGCIPSTLDVVITRCDHLSEIHTEALIGKSDHSVITVSLTSKSSLTKRRLVRYLGRIDATQLRDQPLQIDGFHEPEQVTLPHRWSLIKNGLVQLLDGFAPLRPKRHGAKSCWLRRGTNRLSD